MQASADVARLKREIAALREVASRPRGSKAALEPADRRRLRAEVEWCVQQLDDIRSSLGD